MTPAQRFQYMNCYHFFCAPAAIRPIIIVIVLLITIPPPALIICHVEHVPPFYNSKYDLSKWFQCVHAHKLVCFVTILLSHSLFRSFATFSDYLSTTTTTTTQRLPQLFFFCLFLLSDFGSVSQFTDSYSSVPAPLLFSVSLYLSPSLPLLTVTTVLLRPLFSQRYFLYAFYICHTLYYMHSAHLIVIATVSALLLTHFANCACSCTCVRVCVLLLRYIWVCNAYTCSHQLILQIRSTQQANLKYFTS